MKTDNEIIAEFMGITYNGKELQGYAGEVSEWMVTKANMRFWDDHYSNFFSQKTAMSFLEFHTSWDWLMPVVAKIRQYVIDNQPFGNDYYQAIKNTLIEVDINECHLEVVEFIKWYNSQIKT